VCIYNLLFFEKVYYFLLIPQSFLLLVGSGKPAKGRCPKGAEGFIL
jgi:hypothetical protein